MNKIAIDVPNKGRQVYDSYQDLWRGGWQHDYQPQQFVEWWQYREVCFEMGEDRKDLIVTVTNHQVTIRHKETLIGCHKKRNGYAALKFADAVTTEWKKFDGDPSVFLGDYLSRVVV